MKTPRERQFFEMLTPAHVFIGCCPSGHLRPTQWEEDKLEKNSYRQPTATI
jgi:hypothetical protein